MERRAEALRSALRSDRCSALCSAVLFLCVATTGKAPLLVHPFVFNPSFYHPVACRSPYSPHRFYFPSERADSFGTKNAKQNSRNHKAVALGSSSNENENENETVEYRSIADVVGGLHGGKYQFGGEGWISDAFSGHGGFEGEATTACSDETTTTIDLPNWARNMAPNEGQQILLNVPSNADPMDGMVHSAIVELQNQERTWEKFYAKLMERSTFSSSSFEEVSPYSRSLLVSPWNGSLSPRGGASNTCDASRTHSDRATLRVIQSPESVGSSSNNNRELWLVVGTEEEQWTYKLELLAE